MSPVDVMAPDAILLLPASIAPEDVSPTPVMSPVVVSVETPERAPEVRVACGVGHSSQLEHATGLRCWP